MIIASEYFHHSVISLESIARNRSREWKLESFSICGKNVNVLELHNWSMFAVNLVAHSPLGLLIFCFFFFCFRGGE